MWPRITVITPNLNQQSFLDETIRAVLGQGYPNLEYIIIDGGSTDGSVEIIRKYEKHLAFWCSEPDRGQADALNKGFRRATGEVLGYLNSDDVYTEGALRSVAEAFAGIGNRKRIVSFGGEEFDSVTGWSRCHRPVEPRLSEWLSSPASLFQPSTFWSKALHERVGSFDDSLDFCLDKDFFIRAVFRERAYRKGSERIVARFRVHASGKTARLGDLMREENERIRLKYTRLSWANRVMRHEQAREKAWIHYDRAIRQASWLSRISELLRAARTSPRILLSRQYLGAFRRDLRAN